MVSVQHKKTSIPVQSAGELLRNEISDKLSVWLESEAPILTITAPASYGKTTALAQWCRGRQESGQNIKWMTLDTVDNEPVRFWNLLGNVVIGTQWVSPTVTSLSAHCADLLIDHVAKISSTILVVIDNVELLRDKEILAGLDYLINNLPENLFLILSGRNFLYLESIRKLSLEQKIFQLSLNDLQFRKQELNHFSESVQIDANLLFDLSEGWIAPITFIYNNISSGETVDVSSINEVLTRFYEPIFESYTKRSMAALETMKLIEPFSSSELGFVLGIDDKSIMLIEDCSRETGLIVSVETKGPSKRYRLHKILSRYLESERRTGEIRNIGNIHRRACILRSDQEDFVSALRHAIGSENKSFIVDFLDRTALSLLWQNKFNLDSELFSSDLSCHIPEVVLLKSLLELNRGNREPALRWIEEHASSDSPPDVRDSFIALSILLQAQLLIAQERFNEALPLIERIGMTRVPAELSLYAATLRASALLYLGESSSAHLMLSGLMENEEYRENSILTVDLLNSAAALESIENNYAIAKMYATQSLKTAEQLGAKYHPRSIATHLILAWCHFFEMDEEKTYRSLSFIRESPYYPQSFFDSYRCLSLIMDFADSTDKPNIVNEFEALVHELLDGSSGTSEISLCVLHLTQMLFATQKKRSLTHLKDKIRKRFGNCGEYYLIAGWVYLSAGQTDQAQRLVATVTSDLAPCLSVYGTTFAWALQGAIHAKEGKSFKERESFAKALSIASVNQTFRAFVLIDPQARESLLAHRDHLTDFSRELDLISNFTCNLHQTATPLLTSREIELLHLLASLATVSELADDLQISTNTVKTHIKSIYRKLGVGTRREAITVARSLGIFAAGGSSDSDSGSGS